jgi:hypothetical protein
MIAENVGILRLLRERATRSLLGSAAKSLAIKDGWRKRIYHSDAKFRGNEPYLVAAFLNHILDEMEALGAKESDRDSFRAAFTQLARNAFEHGCRRSRRCRVSVRCAHSTWFIRLEASDRGNGFSPGHISERGFERESSLTVVQGLAGSTIIENGGRRICVLLCKPSIDLDRSTCSIEARNSCGLP